jgi:hypothetical protein
VSVLWQSNPTGTRSVRDMRGLLVGGRRTGRRRCRCGPRGSERKPQSHEGEGELPCGRGERRTVRVACAEADASGNALRPRGALPNKPLQQPNATRFRSGVGSCRDAAGCARDSSQPWYARRRPRRSLLNGQVVSRTRDEPSVPCSTQVLDISVDRGPFQPWRR